jgi:transcription termination factor Rho
MDEVIFEEFKGTGNMEIVLDRALVDRRIWPAIDIYQSGTRREEALLDPAEYQKITIMRKALAGLSSTDAMEQLVHRLQKTRNNAEFLLGLKA